MGLFLLEWNFRTTWRYRNSITELDEKMPAFRRHDAKNWKRWKLIPGAMTVMIPRIVIAILLFAIQIVFLRVMLIGYKINTPMGGCRSFFIRWAYRFIGIPFALLVQFTLITWSHATPMEVNYYEKYLGDQVTRQQELQN